MGLRLERIDGCVERRVLSNHRKQAARALSAPARLAAPSRPREASPPRRGASHAGMPSIGNCPETPPQAMKTSVDRLDASRAEGHDPHQDHGLPTRHQRTMTPVRPWRYARLRSRWCARNSRSNVATTRCIVHHSGVWPAHMALCTVSCVCMQCGQTATMLARLVVPGPTRRACRP